MNRSIPAYLAGMTDVQGSTSRIRLTPFQLESLILAQNERWRQA